MPAANESLTELLHASRLGDNAATGRLMPIVYARLHSLAGNFMRRERPNHTLTPTALIHEAYLKLVGSEVEWADRNHFFNLAARTMRNILVDHAKTRNREKRGGAAHHIRLDGNFHPVDIADPRSDGTILEVDEALSKLAQQDSRKAQLIELLYFGGLTHEEAAEALGISVVTVQRDLRFSKAWLRTALASSGSK